VSFCFVWLFFIVKEYRPGSHIPHILGVVF